MVLEVLATAIRQKIKLSLLADNMILYIKSPERDFSIKKPHTHTQKPIRNNNSVKLQDTKLIYRNLCLYIKRIGKRNLKSNSTYN